MFAVQTLETRPAPRQQPTAAVEVVRTRWRGWLVALLLGALAAAFLEIAWVIAGPNHHTVIPGQVYRSGQLEALDAMAIIRDRGIRSVINLRGCCEDADWYHQERRLLDALGVKMYDITLTSYSLPNVMELRKLICTLDQCEYPILLHCRRGADRTGLASGLALLLRGDADLPTARRQLRWRYGHLNLVQAADLDSVFDMYEAWLLENGFQHQPERLREWVMAYYRPAQCWAEIEPLDVPSQLKCRQRAPARFRVTNRSNLPWRFAREPNVGVHLHYSVIKPDALKGREGDVGFFDHILPAGESLDLTIPLPALREPGRYRLVVDMYDCRMGRFADYGSPRFEGEFDIVAD